MRKAILYYTDNNPKVDPLIISLCQKYIAQSGLPIISVSLQPIDFGKNIVMKDRIRSYPTMVDQIVEGLKTLEGYDQIFFCEHDVLYHPNHFEFEIKNDCLFYYNDNVWRWAYHSDLAITYDRLMSLSVLTANQELLLRHYLYRQYLVRLWEWDERRSREPRWARRMGYEPGIKKKRRGGITDEDYEVWQSPYPNVDIRHGVTFTRSKCALSDFKHAPTGWIESTIDKIPGWELKKLFNRK